MAMSARFEHRVFFWNQHTECDFSDATGGHWASLCSSVLLGGQRSAQRMPMIRWFLPAGYTFQTKLTEYIAQVSQDFRLAEPFDVPRGGAFVERV